MSYFACKRYVADEIIRYNNPYPYMSGLLLRTTKNIKNVTIEHHDRLEGESGYKLSKLISLWVNGFTSFSVKPLRAATCVGIVSAVAGFVYGVYIIINKLINPLTPLGYSSMMAVFLFIGGMMMIMMGIIGEYVGRIYISLNEAPQYVIRRMVSSSQSSECKEKKVK